MPQKNRSSCSLEREIKSGKHIDKRGRFEYNKIEQGRNRCGRLVRALVKLKVTASTSTRGSYFFMRMITEF